MALLPIPSELCPVTQIALLDVRSLDPFETYENLYISYTFAPRQWAGTQIADLTSAASTLLTLIRTPPCSRHKVSNSSSSNVL